ncbi:maltokinase N-terminal cap-like domain-containing protein [Microbacterium sp.]|uniref:maltokinase N-terminal cap-like domain-containing protein n=1 Tax=Microbacterium sp. TaxID=51671 RepID=UPI002E37E6BA|nr:aminoglycoside phosphotransferase [Microbacterium sp.]HEX5727803.1 aminoglycoside phosphotransferase [Microbacterium sp.]
MDSTLACLAAWMPRQRWYAAKGRPPSLRLVAWWDPPRATADGDATDELQAPRVRTFLVADEGSLPPVLYQIPVVSRATATVDASAAHIIGSPEPGTTFIDGPFDPAYSDALLALVTDGGEGQGPHSVATGHPTHSLPVAGTRTAAVLTGEQSNTSLIYRADDGSMPIICKVFRQLHPGLNPDIELQTALADAGSPHVPRAIGSVEGTWPDLATAQGTVSGSLAFAQEFLPGVEDAWRVALSAAAQGEDFRGPARALGAATADVHVSLAQLFPTRVTRAEDRASTAATWRRRLAIAIAEVPAIADRREAIEAVYDRAVDVAWPPLQRIHGDYHLGQVLQVPDRGWVLLDFEGEPLRPMAERLSVDLPLRDVAGMLRSFDYVAGSIRLDHPDRSAEAVRDWALAARRSFIEGYSSASGAELDVESALLAALELDKAVYEAIYESRNRPTWVSIPLRAISRLVEKPAAVS